MGGRPWVSSDKGERFTSILFRYHKKSVKIAFCIFAQPEGQWEDTKSWNQKMLHSFKGDLDIAYRTITTDNFEEVSEWADIIYIPGGDPYVLKEKIEACGDVSILWDGKIIAGSSAGADLFCEAYTYLQDKTMGQGFGWVKAVCIPHWRGDFNNYTQQDWDWAEQESIKQYPHLPVLCIPEGESVEFTVN